MSPSTNKRQFMGFQITFISAELHDIPVSAPETLDNKNVRVQLFLLETPSIEASEVANSAHSANGKSTSHLRLYRRLHLHV
ncbi:hypothetical protein BJV77DRAFT_1071965 [Russula vinacea]|nr:hypothetical protein BJV77DRAFT_1071965 [Russula vinacea]